MNSKNKLQKTFYKHNGLLCWTAAGVVILQVANNSSPALDCVTGSSGAASHAAANILCSWQGTSKAPPFPHPIGQHGRKSQVSKLGAKKHISTQFKEFLITLRPKVLALCAHCTAHERSVH